MKRALFEPLDDAELDRLDRFLLDRVAGDVADKIAAAGDDEGILDISQLDGFLTAVVSGPNPIPPSTWLPAIWGDARPNWETREQFEEIVGLIFRHQNSIAGMLLDYRDDYEPLLLEREVEGKTYTIVDQWSVGFMRGVALDADAWEAAGADVAEMMRQIKLWGTEDGWNEIDAMTDADQVLVQRAIPSTVRSIYDYWLARRHTRSASIRRESPKVGRNDPCPCGSGKKYKQCCLQ